jgi:hypothetical protein
VPDIGAGGSRLPDEHGAAGHGLKAPGAAAFAGSVASACHPDVRDVSRRAADATDQCAVGDDATADAAAELGGDHAPRGVGGPANLSQCHQVGVVVDEYPDAEASFERAAYLVPVPARHPGRHHGDTRGIGHRTG